MQEIGSIDLPQVLVSSEAQSDVLSESFEQNESNTRLLKEKRLLQSQIFSDPECQQNSLKISRLKHKNKSKSFNFRKPVNALNIDDSDNTNKKLNRSSCNMAKLTLQNKTQVSANVITSESSKNLCITSGKLSNDLSKSFGNNESKINSHISWLSSIKESTISSSLPQPSVITAESIGVFSKAGLAEGHKVMIRPLHFENIQYYEVI